MSPHDYITRRTVPRRDGDWKGTMMTWLWAVTFAVVGWVATNTSSDVAKLREVVAQSATEIAVLKSSVANTNAMLAEIKALVIRLQEEKAERNRR